MMFESGFEQLASFIAGAGFGITKPAMGMVEDASYSTLWATIQQLYNLTLEPDVQDAASDDTKFLCPFYGDDLFLEYRAKPINDHDVLGQAFDKGVQGKCMTKKEGRTILRRMGVELEHVTEEWADDMLGDPTEKEEAQQEQEQETKLGVAETAHPEDARNDETAKTETADAGMKPANDEMKTADGNKIEASRPRTPSGAAGSLGPRKSIYSLPRIKGLATPVRKPAGKKTKSLYDKAMETLGNGIH